jgi:DNA-binding transcriptional LysR family regulator
MILRQLVHLLALAQERHFGRAAERAGVSQPGLSASIKTLETELGVPIVQRDHRFIGFTPEGECVLNHARRIQATLDALKVNLQEMGQGLTGRLRLGAIPTALPVVAHLTAPFSRQYPLVQVSVLSLTSDEIIGRMRDFTLDAGITYLDNEPLNGVFAVPLYREEFVFLVPANGQFAGRDSVSWAEAAAAPLCLLTPDMQNRRIIDGVFRSIGAVPEPSIETNSIFNLCAHVSAGHWCSVVPRPLLHLIGLPRDTRVIELVDPQINRTIGLVVADHDPIAPLAQRLIDMTAKMDLASQMAAPLPPITAMAIKAPS